MQRYKLECKLYEHKLDQGHVQRFLVEHEKSETKYKYVYVTCKEHHSTKWNSGCFVKGFVQALQVESAQYMQ